MFSLGTDDDDDDDDDSCAAYTLLNFSQSTHSDISNTIITIIHFDLKICIRQICPARKWEKCYICRL